MYTAPSVQRAYTCIAFSIFQKRKEKNVKDIFEGNSQLHYTRYGRIFIQPLYIFCAGCFLQGINIRILSMGKEFISNLYHLCLCNSQQSLQIAKYTLRKSAFIHIIAGEMNSSFLKKLSFTELKTTKQWLSEG